MTVLADKLTLLVSTITLIIDEFIGRWSRYLSLHFAKIRYYLILQNLLFILFIGGCAYYFLTTFVSP
jgi:hypothetical protein